MITKRLAAATALALSAQFSLVALAHAASVSSAAVTTSVSAAVNGSIGYSGASFPVNQSSGSVIITAVRTGPKVGAMSITYTTGNGTALAGTNYTTKTGTLTWANGDGSAKTFTVPVSSTNVFSGTKYFVLHMTAGANTVLGAHTSATVTITGGTATTPPPPPPPVVKSIKQWVSCSETIDESSQLAAAITAAANNAFVLQIDCPVRFHTGTASNSSITVPDGVTIKFTGEGEFLTVSNGPDALKIAHPNAVTFVDYNHTYL